MKIYSGPSVEKSFHAAVIIGVLSFVLNNDESESNAQQSSTHSPKPVCFFAQVANIFIQDLREDGPAFQKELHQEALTMLSQLHFNAGV